MQDTQQVFLTLQLQKLEQRPKKLKKQMNLNAFRVTLRKFSVELQLVLPTNTVRRDLPSHIGFYLTWMPFLRL